MTDDYTRILEAEVIRANRRRMLPIWLVAGVMLWAGSLAWFEHTFPRVERFVTGEIR